LAALTWLIFVPLDRYAPNRLEKTFQGAQHNFEKNLIKVD
jgi:hypothetical protein